jgi:hypothetical protein
MVCAVKLTRLSVSVAVHVEPLGQLEAEAVVRSGVGAIRADDLAHAQVALQCGIC